MLGDEEIRARAQEAGLTGQLKLASEARRLLHAMAGAKPDRATLMQATEAVRTAREIIERAPAEPGYIRAVEGNLTGLGALSELGPFTGQLHPIAPSIRLELSGERAEAFATYGPAHQGAPGIVHGGIIAGTFDELLGVVQRGHVRMTAELKLVYRGPAFLGRELRYTAWVAWIEGRKASVAGALYDGDSLCAEASALFIAPKTPPYVLPN